jgi:hypothetical protein
LVKKPQKWSPKEKKGKNHTELPPVIIIHSFRALWGVVTAWSLLSGWLAGGLSISVVVSFK